MPTRDFISEVLTHGQLSVLIKRDEDLWFEAKENHEFDLGGNPRHRIQLSKDVSALANAEGGFLLIGLKTVRVAEEQTDRVTELDLLPQAEFDADQFHGVITETVHPKIRGLEVRWIESAETEGLGVGCIMIPPQDPDDQPFLMKRVLEHDIELRQVVFGIARRVGSRNQPRTIEELHRAVQQGKASVPDRLTRLEKQLGEIHRRLVQGGTAEQQPSPPAEERLRDRLNRVLRDE